MHIYRLGRPLLLESELALVEEPALELHDALAFAFLPSLSKLPRAALSRSPFRAEGVQRCLSGCASIHIKCTSIHTPTATGKKASTYRNHAVLESDKEEIVRETLRPSELSDSEHSSALVQFVLVGDAVDPPEAYPRIQDPGLLSSRSHVRNGCGEIILCVKASIFCCIKGETFNTILGQEKGSTYEPCGSIWLKSSMDFAFAILDVLAREL
jgi:hypothetical protein